MGAIDLLVFTYSLLLVLLYDCKSLSRSPNARHTHIKKESTKTGLGSFLSSPLPPTLLPVYGHGNRHIYCCCLPTVRTDGEDDEEEEPHQVVGQRPEVPWDQGKVQWVEKRPHLRRREGGRTREGGREGMSFLAHILVAFSS